MNPLLRVRLVPLASFLVVAVVGGGCRRTEVVAVELGSSESAGGSESSSSDDDTGVPVDCEIPPGHTVCDYDGDPFHGIGLGCPGTDQDSVAIVDTAFASPEATAVRNTRQYGNAFWVAREGTTVLVMSTGRLPEPDGSGAIAVPIGQTWADDGNNANPDDVDLPAPISVASGSQGSPFVDCDGAGDCSETLPERWASGGRAYDLVSMRFDVDVPAGARGFRIDLGWFTAEFPERVDQPANDMFVWWIESEAFTGNLAVYEGEPATVSGLVASLAADDRSGDAPQLIGTGYESTAAGDCVVDGQTFSPCPQGATTGWLVLTGPTVPGERVTMAAALFDQGDANLDSAVVLDNWRWHCPGCDLPGGCGLSE